MQINPGERLDIEDVIGRDDEIARYWRVIPHHARAHPLPGTCRQPWTLSSSTQAIRRTLATMRLACRRTTPPTGGRSHCSCSAPSLASRRRRLPPTSSISAGTKSHRLRMSSCTRTSRLLLKITTSSLASPPKDFEHDKGRHLEAIVGILTVSLCNFGPRHLPEGLAKLRELLADRLEEGIVGRILTGFLKANINDGFVGNP